MLLQDYYKGTGAPFEGDLTVWLQNLPASAKVTKATLRLTPTPLQEPIKFNSATPALGVTKTVIPASPAAGGVPATLGAVEVDFHTRRTLALVAGTGGNANLQVDMGGVYVSIADDGTIFGPGKNLLSVNLSSTAVSLPGLTVSKFKLSSSNNLDVTQVTISSLPSNINVRLGQLPSFWTHVGQLAVPDTSPDFALVLNAFLATAQPQNGFYRVPFIIHSDTLASMDAKLLIEYAIDQPVLPPHLPEITMSYAFNQLPDLDTSLTTPMLPRNAVPVSGATSAQIQGQFQPSRIALDAAGKQTGTANVLVSQDSSLAQPVQSQSEISVTGIDLPLDKASPGLAGLNVAIQADNDGKPSGQVLVRADVTVGKPLPDQSVWGSATLPAPFRILPGQNYWLVLASQVDQVNWRAIPATTPDLALQSSRDGGLSWRAANASEALAPLSALFRFRSVPDRFSIPVSLQIGKEPGAVELKLDKFAPLGRVDLSFDFSQELGTYLAASVAAAPCGNDDLVTNGDLSNPQPDDAALLLFGFDSKPAGDPKMGTVMLGPRVNLSVERFITLSLPSHSVPPALPKRVDCAGSNPAQSTPDEIVNAINSAMGQQVVILLDETNLQLSADVTMHPWCSSGLPTGWQGTSDQIYRFQPKLEDGSRLVVTLLANLNILLAKAGAAQPLVSEAIPVCFQPGVSTPTFPSSSPITDIGPANLSQSLPVTTGCAYHLSILYLLISLSRNTPQLGQQIASWEVSWFDSKGNLLRTDSEDFVPQTRPKQSSQPLPWLYIDAHLAAPPNAVNANLNIINSASQDSELALQQISFTPTQQTLRNGDFQQADEQGKSNNPPAGWSLLGGFIVGQLGQQGVALRGVGATDTVLAQTVDIIAGDQYELHVLAQPGAPPASASDPEAVPIQRRARLELQWMSNAVPGDTIALSLDGRVFSEVAWAGIAPAGVTQAIIRLIQPKGPGLLLVWSVSLAHIDLVPVPLTLLSETPGQLTLSNMHVAYDIPAAALPARRSPSPTPNANMRISIPLPSAAAPDLSLAPVSAPVADVAPASEPAAGSGEATSPSQLPADRPPERINHVSVRLTAIQGIGETRANRLEELGIDSLEKLALTTPEEISQALKGVTVELAAQFIEKARQLLASQQPGAVSPE